MDPVFEFSISLPPSGSRQLLRALHEQLRGAILDGRLKPGLRLPATRALAAAYGISRNTAVATYDLLLSEGYVLARAGSGIYVADVLPQRSERNAVAVDPTNDKRLAPFWRDPPLPAHRASPSALEFRFDVGVPDKREFPFDIWRRLNARALRALSRTQSSYAEAQGRPALRDAIARHVSFARAVSCSAGDIVVTAGAQQAFDVLARVLVTPGRTVVAVENPGYPPARAAFAAAGAKIVPVRVDEEGLVVDELPPQARVIYVTPSHQFPLGVTMSTRRRTALLEFAQRHDAAIVEDDYDGEFRYGERPLDALQTLDRNDTVFYVGTFSKSLFPALRLGYVVTPTWAHAAVTAAKQYADWHCAVVSQDTLAAFIAEGHLARHVRRMRSVYAGRRDALLDALKRDFPRWFEAVPSSAGLHLGVRVRKPANAEAIAKLALDHGIGIGTLKNFQLGKAAQQALIFGFATLDANEIRAGLARLKRLLDAE